MQGVDEITSRGRIPPVELTAPQRDKKIPLFHETSATAVAQWLRCCATNRKVAGSIPDGVTGIFH